MIKGVNLVQLESIRTRRCTRPFHIAMIHHYKCPYSIFLVPEISMDWSAISSQLEGISSSPLNSGRTVVSITLSVTSDAKLVDDK